VQIRTLTIEDPEPVRAEASRSWSPLTDELIQRHQRGVWRYLRSLGCEAALAEDLTQEAFLALLRQPPRVTVDRVLARWLRTTAHNLYRNSGRRRRSVALVDEAVAEAAWTDLVRRADADDAVDAVRACLDALPERMRVALEVRYGPDGTRARVGDRLDLAADGVKTLLRRARERLLRCVKHRQGHEEQQEES